MFGIFALDTSPAMMDQVLRYYFDELAVNPLHTLIVINRDVEHDGPKSSPAALERLALVMAHRGMAGYFFWDGVWSNSNMAILRKSILADMKSQGLLQPSKDWILELDADELQVYPRQWYGSSLGLPAFVAACEDAGVNAVFGVWRDRLAADGRLHDVALDAPLVDQYPVLCNLRTVGKIMIRRGNLEVSDGKHKLMDDGPNSNVTRPVYLRHVLAVLHFKWVKGAVQRLELKVKQARGQGRVDHRSIDILDHLSRHNGVDVTTFANNSICCGRAHGAVDPNWNEPLQRLPCDTTRMSSNLRWGSHDSKPPWHENGVESRLLPPPPGGA